MKSPHRITARALLLLTAITTTTHASTMEPYIGGAGIVASVSGYGDDGARSLALVRGMPGVDLSRYIGVEAHLGLRVAGDVINEAGTEYEIQRYAAGYARLILPVSEHGRLFALLGASQITNEASNNAGSSTDDSTGLSYGLGGEMAVTEALRVGADVIALNGNGGSKMATVSAGARWSL